MQDAANLFVYLPRRLDFTQMLLSMLAFLLLLGVVCYQRGGEIQNIIKLKTNTGDISACKQCTDVHNLGICGAFSRP